jgi:tetratricopeptide (TPR) repeat protein
MLSLLIAASVAGSMPFIEDDYPKALEQARAQHKPLFIDFSATWCHSCLSMQRYVLADPGMKPVADSMVWLAIETEAEKNKQVVDEFPLDVWPTFLVVDAENGKVLARWLGSGSVQEIRAFVQEGARAYREKGKLDAASAEQRKGDEARLRGDLAASAEAYGKALALSKPADPQRPERLALYANGLRKLKTPQSARTCVRLALKEMGNTGESAIATDFIGYAESCAGSLPESDEEVLRLRALAIERIGQVLARPDAPLAADDRSDALANLAELLDMSHRHDEAVAAMKQRAEVLEKAAAAAPDATTASTFDPHRTDTYLYLKTPTRAEQLLAQREKEMPADYNPPARLARVYLTEKKLPEAEAAVDRALKLMTRGQRRIGILALKAKILDAQGKSSAAVVREELEVMRELPKTQRNADAEKKLDEQLRKTARN